MDQQLRVYTALPEDLSLVSTCARDSKSPITLALEAPNPFASMDTNNHKTYLSHTYIIK